MCFRGFLWKVFLLLGLHFPPPRCCLPSPSASQLSLAVPHCPFSPSRWAGGGGGTHRPWAAHAALSPKQALPLFPASTGSWDHPRPPQRGGRVGTSKVRAKQAQLRDHKDARSWVRKLPARGGAYLLLDAILDDRSPVQPQEALLRQVPHQADDGLLTALGGHAFLLLLIHDHLLNPAASQDRP